MTRDIQRPVRILRAEYDAILPILRRTPDASFDLPTACPGWSVRDVLAHCEAALSRAATDTLHAFTPELNEIDVDERRGWPLPTLLDRLAAGYLAAGPAIRDSDGRMDVLALGEWLHGGDVRDALGEPLPYASDGFIDACVLLADRASRREVPLLDVTLPDAQLTLGAAAAGRATATLRTSNATLMRLFAGRPSDPNDYELDGATVAELVVF